MFILRYFANFHGRGHSLALYFLFSRHSFSNGVIYIFFLLIFELLQVDMKEGRGVLNVSRRNQMKEVHVLQLHM
jgi:hypothetical protein